MNINMNINMNMNVNIDEYQYEYEYMRMKNGGFGIAYTHTAYSCTPCKNDVYFRLKLNVVMNQTRLKTHERDIAHSRAQRHILSN